MSSGPPAGYRGYIASRLVAGNRTPQHIQNLVLRDYARRKGLVYKLSATEYAMEHCYMILEQVVTELPAHSGIILYSMFMMPERTARRRTIYDRVLRVGCSLHAAVEDLVIESQADITRWEDVFMVHVFASRMPLEIAHG